MHITTTKGDIGVAKVTADLLEKGLQVLVPTAASVAYDLVIYDGSKYFKAQVKYRTKNSSGILQVELRRTTMNNRKKMRRTFLTLKDVDIIAVYCPDTRECYYFLMTNLKVRTMSLRIDPTKNNQAKSVLWAKNYTNFPTKKIIAG